MSQQDAVVIYDHL